MKELSRVETPESDKVVIEQSVEKGYILIGGQRKIKGLIMFEFDPINLTLEPAQYKSVKAEFDNRSIAKVTIHNQLIMKDGCVYIQALNKKNA